MSRVIIAVTSNLKCVLIRIIIGDVKQIFQFTITLYIGATKEIGIINSKKFGAVYYNKGIEDAQKVVERKMLDISDELYEIEQIVEI